MPPNPPILDEPILKEVNRWLEQVVIGLNLCPFATWPQQQKQIRFAITPCDTEACLLQALHDECILLENTPAQEIETTLLIIPNLLHDFYDYNDFLDLVEGLIEEHDWHGVFQVATFHPNYQFGGTQPNDDENLTNRSPYPILHLLREVSLEKAIEHYPNTEEIPERNIDTVTQLSLAQKKSLFPYLY